MTGFSHESVLLEETVDALRPADGEVFVDCTVGGGGHAYALLSRARCRVIGLDRDPVALDAARARCAAFGDRFTAVHARFSEVGRVLDDLGLDRVNGLLADLGVSSHQLDVPERGFSFRRPGPVDMRMDPTSGDSAADLINHSSESELADLIYAFGEERRSRQVARAIVAGRPWTDTVALAEAVGRAVGGKPGRIHPATRTFQALRMAVNDELGEVEALLRASVGRLLPDGRLAIITFHSLEDRLVKQFLAGAAGKNAARDAWGNPVGPIHFEVQRPVVPSEDDPNPRARSARLRTARRLPWNAP